ELRRHADVLERHLRDVADIEFTVEQGRLWLLQARVGKRSPRAALRMAIDMADDPDFPVSREEAVRRVAPLLADPPSEFVFAGDVPEPLTRGLPASPGVASGPIALSSQAALTSPAPAILVRPETSPEDVAGMSRAAGVLTARGGVASHAAVVARGWGIPAVVGASAIAPADDHVEIAGRRLPAGETISIDGSTGAVYLGRLDGDWQVAPEAATLLEWASALGVAIKSDGEAKPIADEAARQADTDVLAALAIKGTLPAHADGVGELVARGLAEHAGSDARLTAQGKLAAAEGWAIDRSRVGESRALELLDEFHELDVRIKEIVTAWQLREQDGEQVLNDHTDTAYDEQVLGDLARLHADATVWLATLAGSLPRFGGYLSRLGHAIESARHDQRFVASPRVDSYHSVWFELHEDLIRLAGKRRAETAG
ncbi:MAG TPA: PEP-utilizing enzyme, partial [Actinomycetes bacterium]|nr:PEP-utilizing enzyme [Actinomycetes bacterium]